MDHGTCGLICLLKGLRLKVMPHLRTSTRAPAMTTRSRSHPEPAKRDREAVADALATIERARHPESAKDWTGRLVGGLPRCRQVQAPRLQQEPAVPDLTEIGLVEFSRTSTSGPSMAAQGTPASQARYCERNIRPSCSASTNGSYLKRWLAQKSSAKASLFVSRTRPLVVR